VLHYSCEFPLASWTPCAAKSKNKGDIANMPVEAKWHWLKLLIRGKFKEATALDKWSSENVAEIKQMNSYVLERRRRLCTAKNQAKCNENSSVDNAATETTN